MQAYQKVQIHDCRVLVLYESPICWEVYVGDRLGRSLPAAGYGAGTANAPGQNLKCTVQCLSASDADAVPADICQTSASSHDC